MDTLLILGGFVFRDFEVPPKISYGGKQRLQTHKIIGGSIVIDALGPEPDPIKWEGRFRGSSAPSRCRTLNALRASGAQLPLSWGSNFYMVVISHFEADEQRYYEIPYKIICTVVTDPVAGAGGIIGSLTSLIQSDLSAIAGLRALL